MTGHPTRAEIDRYATAGSSFDEAALWSIEVHLESCAECRACLAGSLTDASRTRITQVAAILDREIAAGPEPPRRAVIRLPHRQHWFVPSWLSWVAMTAAVLAAAMLLSELLPRLPSIVLLLAPLAPLPGVAAAWSRRADPLGELIASTPAVGLMMLLRRTAAVLILIVPVLAVTGGFRQFALMLLPGLAFTAGTLLLGSVVGVQRAAIGLITGWALAVVAPSLVTARLPVLLTPTATGGWVVVAVLSTGFTLLRAARFRHLTSSW